MLVRIFFFPWTLNDVANPLGEHTEKWRSVVERFAARGSESSSSHAKNTSSFFQLIRTDEALTGVAQPPAPSSSTHASEHQSGDRRGGRGGPRVRPQEQTRPFVTTLIRLGVKGHPAWNRAPADTAVTEGPAPHHSHHHLLLSLRYQSPAIVQSLPEACLRS